MHIGLDGLLLQTLNKNGRDKTLAGAGIWDVTLCIQEDSCRSVVASIFPSDDSILIPYLLLQNVQVKSHFHIIYFLL